MARVEVPVTELTPPKASLTTSLAGTNNDLVFTARTGGPGGNSIRVQYVVAGNNTPLSVDILGYDIIVNVATDGGGAATSTAAQVMSAVQRSASHLVTVELATSNDGTGIVTALAITNLAGGSLQKTPPSQTNGDSVNGHFLTGNDGLVTLEVVSSDGSPQTVSIDYSPNYAPIVDVAATAESIPAGATRILGPFAPSAFDQNSSHDLYFTVSVSTNLKFRAYKTVKAT
jgi:hypothetical protein